MFTPALIVAMSLAAGGGAPDPLPWDGASFRRYVDASAHVAFPVPLTQTLVESRHFRSAAPEQMTDVLTLSGPDGFEVEIGIWKNARGLKLTEWIAEYVPFLLTPSRMEMPWRVSSGRIEARLFEHLRDGQQFGRRTAVFLVGGRAFRVTCIDKDAPRSAAVFETVISALEVLE